MRFAATLSTVTLLGALGAHAVAAPITMVEYSGSTYVTGTKALGGKGTGYDNSTPISPASDYAGPTLYGAAATTDATAAPLTTWSIINDQSLGVPGGTLAADWIQLSNSGTSGSAAKSHYAFLFFKQSEFANGGSGVAGGVDVTSDSSFQVRVRRTGGSPSSVRYVMQTGGATFYISQGSELTSNQANGELITVTDPTALNWFSYSPGSSISSIGAAATGLNAPDFNSVTGLGVWLKNDRAGGNDSGMNVNFTDIKFTAVVPEPATMGLLALGGLMARRRRG